jgi:hypothetical protein
VKGGCPHLRADCGAQIEAILVYSLRRIEVVQRAPRAIRVLAKAPVNDGKGRAMDLQAIYVKTTKGQEELATRAYKLPSRVRNLLVMVDGAVTGEQIVETTVGLGNSAAFFSLLVDEGFVEAIDPALIQASGKSATAPNKELVQFVSHLVTDLLGPTGDSLTLRLEKAGSIEEFSKHAEHCREVVENAVGKKKGDQFWAVVVEKISA